MKEDGMVEHVAGMAEIQMHVELVGNLNGTNQGVDV
jgi:hypothetical protein